MYCRHASVSALCTPGGAVCAQRGSVHGKETASLQGLRILCYQAACVQVSTIHPHSHVYTYATTLAVYTHTSHPHTTPSHPHPLTLTPHTLHLHTLTPHTLTPSHLHTLTPSHLTPSPSHPTPSQAYSVFVAKPEDKTKVSHTVTVSVI